MRGMRKVYLPVGMIMLFFAAGLLLTNPSKAQQGSTWLPFDRSSTPAEPSLVLLRASPIAIELEARLPGAYAETVTEAGTAYTRLSGTGYGYPLEYGMPEVPVLRHEVEIPFGAEVSVEVISTQSTTNSLSKLGLNPIYPMQMPVPKLEGAEDQQPFVIDSNFYAYGEFYPTGVVSLGEPYIVRGHRILPVEVWPVSYDSSQASLRLTSQVTFRLILAGADMAATQRQADRYASPIFDSSLSRRVLNYNQGRPLAVNEQVGYLIITADPYEAALSPLVTLRQNRGFAVTLTRTSGIPGGATTGAIKAYIQAAYDTWAVPPSYVLLVGDTDSIPTWTGPEIYTSTDLYYATMDGAEDWHPDIGRGRFPVRSASQATNMVDKLLSYAVLTGQEPWLKTASFPGSCDGTYHGVAEETHDTVIANHMAPGGFTGTFPVNPNPGGDQLYCIRNNATHEDLVEQFSMGRWGIIYSGHGSYQGWEMSFVPQDIRDLPVNSMYPFVASHACLTGDFGQFEVFGETWVLQQDKGALVYWGSSTLTYWGEDDLLERKMFDALFADNTPHADVTEMTYSALAEEEIGHPLSARYYWETYNLLGDPTVHLFMDPELPFFTLNATPSSGSVCTSGTMTSTVEIGSVLNYSSTVYLASGDLPFNVSASFDVDQASAPYTATLSLDVLAGAPEGDHTIAITATDQVSQTLATDVHLRINTDTPAAPALFIPADGALNQTTTPFFDWDDLALVDDYRFELAASPLFENPLVSVGDLPTSDYTLTAPLDGGSCYWWRAQADNACGTGSWAEPFQFGTVAMGVSFVDDLESGEGNWTHQAAAGIDHWVLTTQQAHSPTHSWFVPDDETITDSSLWTTQPIPVGEGSMLTFWHRFAFEGPGYDGGVLEISSNHGDSWSDLGAYITANGYNGSLDTGFGNPLGGREAWTGDIIMWEQVSVDLSNFAGQAVMIRWRVGCDTSYGDDGWVIDDVQITAPLPPNPAPLLLSITPDSGSTEAPTPVIITGSGFLDTAALKLGDTWLESFSLVNATTIEVEIPAGLSPGVYDLTLINGDCQEASLSEAFEVLSPFEYHYIFLPVTVK